MDAARLPRALALLRATDHAADALTFADAFWLANALPLNLLDGEMPQAEPRPPKTKLLPPTNAESTAVSVTENGRRASGPGRAQTNDVSQVALYQHEPGRAAGGDPLRATRVPVPSAEALPGRTAIERALRPFMRRFPSPVRRELDAIATAQLSAQRPHITPVFRPRPERWFDVTLVIDASEPMVVWSSMARELGALLTRHGAFRRVALWNLVVDKGEVGLRSETGPGAGPRQVVGSHGRQLVLVLTHGQGALWREPGLAAWFAALSRHAVIALFQMLPTRAWPFTLLGDASTWTESRERAVPNAHLLVQDFLSGRFSRSRDHPVVPVLPLEVDAIKHWARFVMAPRSVAHRAVRLDPMRVPAGARAYDPETVAKDAAGRHPRDNVAVFRSRHSPSAFQLMRLLSASPLTLPVMRLVQRASSIDQSPSVLAEVLMSGLLRRVHGQRADDDAVYEFLPGIRLWLRGGLSRTEARTVDGLLAPTQEALRLYIQEKTGNVVADFTALVLDERGSALLPPAARAFVHVARELYERRGLIGAPAGGTAAPPASGIAPSGGQQPRSNRRWRVKLRPPNQRSAYASILSDALVAQGHALVETDEEVSVAIGDEDEAVPPTEIWDFVVATNTPVAAVMDKLISHVPAGRLIGWPQFASKAVEREREVDALAHWLETECQHGRKVTLTAYEDSGARLLLARAFIKYVSLRQRFPGGIYLEGRPVDGTSSRGPLLRVALASVEPSRPKDCALTMVYVRRTSRNQPVIGYPTPAEAEAHLVEMGLRHRTARELEPVHECVPKQIVLAGSLCLRKVSAAAQMRAAGMPAGRYDALLRMFIDTLSERERTDLMRLQVLRPGGPAHDEDTEQMAAQLCWLCEGPGGSRWLDPTAARWLGMLRPDLQSTARIYLVNWLTGKDLPPDWHAYRNRWLLVHAYESKGVDRILDVLDDSRLRRIVLVDRRQLEMQLAEVADRLVDRRIDELLAALRLEVGEMQFGELVHSLRQRQTSGLKIALAVPRTEDAVVRNASRLLETLGHEVLPAELDINDLQIPRESANVRECDLVVAIVQDRYGVPLDGSAVFREDMSAMEFTYREALRLHKPLLVFMKSVERAGLSLPTRVEMQRFRQQLEAGHQVIHFRGHADLHRLLSSAVASVRAGRDPRLPPTVDDPTVIPKPGPVLNAADLQQGRWGGAARRDGRVAEAVLCGVTKGIFYFDVAVDSTDGSALRGPVVFHLHDTYPKKTIHIRKIRDGTRAILQNVSSRGVYCIGIQVRKGDGTWTSLELDLRQLASRGLPERFLQR
ncbi:SAV_2336 N-terminal domain-related protein [Variovorax sp. RT4R15]|uniref:SAV_2336 N-terminal domain-related protein n=1 Tax=Variovorax sp. RT4R15 TaxID=3443737 RepID=UPI003F46F58B